MIEFREDTHEYFLDGKKLISVTQLMQKHGLAPSYDGVPSDVLRAKSERGTLIHKEIEDYIKTGEIGFTSELFAFIDYVKNKRIDAMESESIVHNDICAGTVDFIYFDYDEVVISDFKTTATLHKDAISWQLSIYATLYEEQMGVVANKAKAYHFTDDGLKVVDIPFKPREEVLRLLECERNGEIYTQEIEVSELQLAELYEIESVIASIEQKKKEAEQQATELRAVILGAMEKTGCKSIENDWFKITYVAPSTRDSVDTAKLKKEMPEIAQKYNKTSKVKASLRITTKE